MLGSVSGVLGACCVSGVLGHVRGVLGVCWRRFRGFLVAYVTDSLTGHSLADRLNFATNLPG